MIKMLSVNKEDKSTTLTLILDFENLDRLLADRAIHFRSEDIGQKPGILFIMFFTTPVGKQLLAELTAADLAGVCVFALPPGMEPQLRAGKVFSSQRTLPHGALKVDIMASADIEVTAEAIRKSGLIQPYTRVVSSGFHPEKKVEGMN